MADTKVPFKQACKKVLPHVEIETVKRSDTAVGFEVISRRWVVERTLPWLSRCRRLAKDVENRTRTARAFLMLASIRLMLRRLCLKTQTYRTDSEVKRLDWTVLKVVNLGALDIQ